MLRQVRIVRGAWSTPGHCICLTRLRSWRTLNFSYICKQWHCLKFFGAGPTATSPQGKCLAMPIHFLCVPHLRLRGDAAALWPGRVPNSILLGGQTKSFTVLERQSGGLQPIHGCRFLCKAFLWKSLQTSIAVSAKFAGPFEGIIY